MKRIIFSVSLILALLLSLSSAALAQNGPTRTLPDFIKGLKLETGLSDLEGLTPATLGLDRSLVGVTGPQEVVVRLTLDPVLQLKVDGQGVAAQLRQLRTVKSQQNAFLRDARKVGGGIKVLGATQRVLNGVILKVDGAMLPTLAKNPAVYSIKPVRNYDYAPIETNLEYAVPYVGGTDMHNMGYTGEGVTIGIIDTGVDYNHALMGGSGDVNDYNNNNPSIIEPGTFPTAKVIGGYDFVGETWPNTDLTPDPDPLDSKPAGGHGTHVASTAAGLTGMAPDASVYALKVCSSQRNTCSGTAMLQALDWITDPNGDGMTDDHADVVNMSIGSLYGQPWDDDTSQAVELASMAGVLVVTSAGNNGDLPYVSGTPGATLSALSTAATNNPSGSVQLADVLVDSSLVKTVGAQWQSWSHTLDEVIQAPVQYGDGAGGNRNGCASFAPGTLTGKIVLVDRGTCNFSLKISNIADGDGLIGIIGLVAPGDPFDGAFGAGDPSRIPGYMITQADSNLIKSLIADGVEMNFTPGMEESQGGTVASFSSRGPGQFPFKFPGSTETMTNFIKPEIAAPGVITAAAYGTGTGLVTYQGTSMASPMVAGSAALVKQARPNMSGREIKALLVNNADTEVRNKVAIWGGELAPITRVGGGEVHVDRAVMAPAAAWENHTLQPSLSFGFVDAANRTRTVLRTIQVKNYTNAPITYHVSYTFRFADDEAMDAVALNIKGVDADGMVTVPANGMVLIPVELNILSTALPMWGMDSGALGANGSVLTKYEFDGYVWFDDVNTTADDESMMHLAWHVLPRQSGNVLTPNGNQATLNSEYMGLPAGNVALTNDGSGYAFIDVYSLLGTSDNLPEGGWGMQSPIIDLKYVGVQTYPVPAGYCSSSESFVWVFNVSTWERTAHADVPAEFDVYLDTDPGSAGPEYVAYTTDLGWATTGSTDGRNVTAVVNLATGSGTIWFFTGHSTNSANYQLLMCGEQIGMDASDFFTPVGVDVYAFDNYFTGDLTDYIEGMVAAPLGERYGGIIDDYGFGDIPGGKLNPVTNLTVVDWGVAGTNPGELGLLLVTTGVRGDYSSGAPRGNENIVITVAP